MGLSFLSYASSEPSSNTQGSGNPDPYQYKVKRHVQIDQHLVVEIRYPSCRNYEGKKILVYKNLTYANFRKHIRIDPHFSDSKVGIFPIARFVPTIEGWNFAVSFAKLIDKQ